MLRPVFLPRLVELDEDPLEHLLGLEITQAPFFQVSHDPPFVAGVEDLEGLQTPHLVERHQLFVGNACGNHLRVRVHGEAVI